MRKPLELLLDALKERGLTIAVDKGKPVLRGDRKEVTPELLTAMKHFRRELLLELGMQESVEEDDDHLQDEVEVPKGAKIVVADKDGYTDREMRGPPYMWTWEGGATWLYVHEHPIPTKLG